MERDTQLFGIIILISLLLLMNSGCTEQKKPVTHETLQAILEKAAVLESVSYEINTTFLIDGIIPQITTMKIWQKPSFLKEEITTITISTNSTQSNITTTLNIIQRPEGVYRYDNTTGTYQLDPEQIIPQPSTTDMVQNLQNNQTLIIIGTEDLNGTPTTVIQYHPNQGGNATTVTLWIWDDNGVPLKEQYTSTIGGSVTITSFYTNYSFAEIPDSVFSVE
jgi:outer membrane lipoprotein-sorting protein